MYSVVVPVFNSEKSLPELAERIKKVFEEVVFDDYELILVDDGSEDGSYEVMKRLHDKDGRVKCIQLATNHGQQRAVMCGFEYVKGDFVITLDDDLQHPPEEIPVLIKAMEEHEDADVVIGAYDSKKHGIIRRMGSSLMNASSNLIYKKNKDIHMTSFRLMRRYVVDNLNQIAVSVPTIGPLLLQTNQRIINVTVHHDERAYGKSGYSFRKLVNAYIGSLVNNSDVLAKGIAGIGCIGMILGIAGWIWLLIKKAALKSAPSGWSIVVATTLLLFGFVMIAIGIVGKYVSNLMGESKKMSKYYIKDKQL